MELTPLTFLTYKYIVAENSSSLAGSRNIGIFVIYIPLTYIYFKFFRFIIDSGRDHISMLLVISNHFNLVKLPIESGRLDNRLSPKKRCFKEVKFEISLDRSTILLCSKLSDSRFRKLNISRGIIFKSHPSKLI